MKLTKITVVFAAILYLSGCASAAKTENMVYQGAQKNYSAELKENVAVADVSGGQKTNPLWTSEVSNEDFAAAIRESLSAQGLLADAGRYQLIVKLLIVDQPLFAIDFKVTMHVQYSLLDTQDNSTIFNETIVAPYTADFGDAFFGIKRLRLANEGAGQRNIDLFLEKLSELKINKNDISLAE